MIKNIQYFARVAETGSFTSAAREFGVGQPLISKSIQALELELGTKLFHRSTRGLSLTEEGEAAYQRSLRLLEDYEALLATQEDTRQARGLVRVSVPLNLGVLKIIPLLEGFLKDHPGIVVDLKMSDAFSDLIADGIDIAVRAGEIKDSRLIVKPVGTLKRYLVASKRYIQLNGEPHTPADLKHHNCIVGGPEHLQRQWSLFKNGKKITVGISGRISVDNLMGMRSAVLANLGIARVGELLFLDKVFAKQAVPILTDYSMDALPLNIVFTQNRYVPFRVRVVIDFLADILR